MQFYALESIDREEKSKRSNNEYPVDNDYISEEPMNLGVADRCPCCQTVLSGKDWLPSYYIELDVYRRSEFADIIFGTAFVPIVIERFKNSYVQTNLKGLIFREKVNVINVRCMWGAKQKLLPEIPDYYLTKPERGTTSIDHEKSGSVFLINGEPKCDFCRSGKIMRIQQLVVDESTWDGRDIFQINGVGQIVTTQKFKDWFDSNQFVGMRLIPVEEFSFDHYWGQTPEEWAESVRIRKEKEASEKSTPPSTS